MKLVLQKGVILDTESNKCTFTPNQVIDVLNCFDDEIYPIDIPDGIVINDLWCKSKLIKYWMSKVIKIRTLTTNVNSDEEMKFINSLEDIKIRVYIDKLPNFPPESLFTNPKIRYITYDTQPNQALVLIKKCECLYLFMKFEEEFSEVLEYLYSPECKVKKLVTSGCDSILQFMKTKPDLKYFDCQMKTLQEMQEFINIVNGIPKLKFHCNTDDHTLVDITPLLADPSVKIIHMDCAIKYDLEVLKSNDNLLEFGSFYYENNYDCASRHERGRGYYTQLLKQVEKNKEKLKNFRFARMKVAPRD